MVTDNSRKLIERATAIQKARNAADTVNLVRQHLEGADEIRRLGLEDTLKETQALRDEMLAMKSDALSDQRELMDRMLELLKSIRNHVITPPIVNVPKASVTLQQQPVQVNVPAPKVTVTPTTTVPAAEVVVQTTQNKLPTTATIKHSDGTQSKIDFS